MHPQYLLSADAEDWFMLWEACRDGKAWPEAGGYLQQPAKVLAGFAVMDRAARKLVAARAQRMEKK